MLKWYWVGNNLTGNFGDVLTPKLLDHFNIPYTFVGDPQKEFDAMCIGSIARWAKKGTSVFGSGFMSRNHTPNIEANYRFVRGPISRNMIINAGGSCPEIYGDPALLLPLLCDESKKEYDVGIIPHVVHYEAIKKEYKNEFVINLFTKNALEVASEITKCRMIISSSLHGIIAANAYGIPAAWVDFGPIKGDGMKFEEHFMSGGITNAKKSSINDPVFYNGTYNINPIKDIFTSFANEINLK